MSLRPLVPHAAVALFSLIVATPLARGLGACTDDAALHVIRAVELERLIRLGHYFPRWAPDMAHGFGYPLFNYYAPLSAYVVVAFHSLGVTFPVALHLAFFAAIVASGLATFSLARDLWGAKAGLVAAAGYVSAPYFAYDILFRGALAESFAWLWPPLILWAMFRALSPFSSFCLPSSSRLRYSLLAAAAYAGLILTHNNLALLASPLIISFVVLLAWERRHKSSNTGAPPSREAFPRSVPAKRSFFLRTLLHGALILLGGLALSAYFWLPALAESNLVHTDRLLVPPIFTYYTNWLTPGELFAPPTPDDPRLINPSPAKALGLVPALLALPAVIGLARPGFRSQWPRVVFFAAALTVYALMTLPVTKPLWDHLPLLPLTQFPWRMLSLAALCAALLAGAAVKAVSQYISVQSASSNAGSSPPASSVDKTSVQSASHLPRTQAIVPVAKRSGMPGSDAGWSFYSAQSASSDAGWSSFGGSFSLSSFAAALLSASLILANLPWWYPRYCNTLREANLASISRYEYQSATIGTTAKGEFLPVTVPAIPPDDSLAEAVLAGQEPDRIDRTFLPLSATYSYLSRDPLATRFSIEAETSYSLAYKNFYFPGWRVLVDGKSVPIQVTPDYGLISFDLHPGKHLVEVRFDQTPLRLFASLISLISFLSLLSLLALTHFLSPRPSPHNSDDFSRPPNLSDVSRFTFYVSPAYLLLPIGLLALKLLWLDRYPNPLRFTRFDGQSVPQAQQPLRAVFASGIRLYGYDLSRASVPSGQSFDVSVYAGLQSHVENRYVPVFSLEDARGLAWSVRDQIPPRWHREPPRTPLWPTIPHGYAQWSREVEILPGTPPGIYRLWATVLELDTRAPDSVLDDTGNPISPRLLLAEVEVVRSRQPVGKLELRNPVGRPLSPALTLLGYDVDRSEARPGDTMLLTAYWQAQIPPVGEVVEVRLVGANGEAVWELEPVPGFPPEEWQNGDVWRGPHLLVLPATLRSGDYRFELGIKGGETVELARLRIEAPPHVFEQPDVQVELDVRMGDVAKLVGYNLDGSTVTLFWQALGETPVGYSAFVHLSDQTGHIFAQSDGVPAGAARPTTSWLEGEFIVDPHSLTLPPDLPPGDYLLYTGLYDPKTGVRLATGSEDGRVFLGVFTHP